VISVLALCVTTPSFAQIIVGSPTVIEHPAPGQCYQLAEVYPGTTGTYTSGISPNQCWSGPTQSVNNIKAVPGIFCLERIPSTFKLNINAFATCGVGEQSPAVQSFRLKKQIPGSMKCPDTYKPKTIWQFGSGIRTWWTLLYTQPGTKFVLEVTVRCLTKLTNQPKIHIDRWSWEVVADLTVLDLVIDALHQGTMGTMEIPCIAGEDMYEALKAALTDLKTAPDRASQQDALFNMEALVIAYTAFGEFMDGDVWFPAGPPSDIAPLTPFNIAGIIDTLENPCGCKIIVDLEYIGTALGIVSL
jgi:hypothetical protein